VIRAASPGEGRKAMRTLTVLRKRRSP